VGGSARPSLWSFLSSALTTEAPATHIPASLVNQHYRVVLTPLMVAFLHLLKVWRVDHDPRSLRLWAHCFARV
jgi:hypothetical protein